MRRENKNWRYGHFKDSMKYEKLKINIVLFKLIS